MSLLVQNLSYIHPDGDVRFHDIGFSVSRGTKCAIIGDNGIGKSTLLNILAGNIPPTGGRILCESAYLVPQHFGQFDGRTVAEALGVADKLQALSAISNGEVSEKHFAALNDDWTVEERIAEAFARWDIAHVSASSPMSELSGGEKTKVFLAGILIHGPAVVLMDEPTNHLDTGGRHRLYEYIRETGSTVLIVSHDRVLLNRLSALFEMSPDGMRFYPMPYDSYKELRDSELAAKTNRLASRQKEWNQAKKTARETAERQLKRNSRGEKRNEKKCIARIAMGNLHDKAQASTARLNKTQQDKMQSIGDEIREIRASIPQHATMKINIGASDLHTGKRLVEAKAINYAYPHRAALWDDPLSFSLFSGERIRLRGGNGQGKSTLLKLITGAIVPTEGEIRRAASLRCAYLDQEYSRIDDGATVFEQLAACHARMQEHELKTCLNRFLFPASSWDRKCARLSGGEKMKLALCCLTADRSAPEVILADEPTNNIDLSSTAILTDTLKAFRGTLIVVSHDERFVEEIGITRNLTLERDRTHMP